MMTTQARCTGTTQRPRVTATLPSYLDTPTFDDTNGRNNYYHLAMTHPALIQPLARTLIRTLIRKKWGGRGRHTWQFARGT